MSSLKVCQMNTNFENLIYNKYWTNEVIKEWKEMLPTRYVFLF